MMKILVKCWTPEWYDEVSHALIEITPELVRYIHQKMVIAQSQNSDDTSFLRIEFFDYTPEFIDCYQPEVFGLTEQEFNEVCDGGWWEVDEVDESKLTTRQMETMTVRVNPTDFSWKAHAKHGGANTWAETCTLYAKDLREWAQKLGVKLDG